MRKSFAVLLLAVFAALVPAASAAPVTVPAGLNPGDHYRLAFVTTTSRDGTSTNIDDYNAFAITTANSVPELLALGTSWTAIASTLDDDARDNTATNPTLSTGVPIYRLDGTKIAENNADLWDGYPLANLTITQTGSDVSSEDPYYVWTGTDPFGSAAFGDYLGLDFAVVGRASYMDSTWIADHYVFTTDEAPFYAMSGVLTVVPEPDTIVLACLAAAGLAVSSIRRRRP